MSGIRIHIKVFLSAVTAFIFITGIVLISLGMYTGNIAVYLTEKYTGYEIKYDKWENLSIDKVAIDSLEIAIPDTGLSLNVEKAYLTIDIRQFISARKLFLLCDLKGVTFAFDGNKEDKDSLMFSDGILNLPLDLDHEYGHVYFKLFRDKKIVRLSDFTADFNDIRLKGGYSFYEENNESSIDLTVSISPDIAGVLEDEIKDNVLAREDDGWYSTVINYKGSTVLLKAIYSLSVS